MDLRSITGFGLTLGCTPPDQFFHAFNYKNSRQPESHESSAITRCVLNLKYNYGSYDDW